jgi:hypothetical protein
MAGDRSALGRMRAAARAAFEGAYCDRATLPRLDAVIEGRAAEGVPAGRARDYASAGAETGAARALETAGAA